MKFQVIFSHGQESGPVGTKILALSKVAESHGMDVDSIDYTDLKDPEARVQRLVENIHARPSAPTILVGSSMGAYVSLVAAETLQPAGVFLMAPALYLPGWKHQQYTRDVRHVSIVHGWSDELIAPENAIRYASESHCDLHLIDADHRLSGQVEALEALFDDFLQKVSGR